MGFNKYFNPRSREGSDRAVLNKVNLFSISIHAPAKGATWHIVYGTNVYVISIHAPAKGATLIVLTRPCRYLNFNPRSREGSDSAKLHCLWLKLINTKELLFPKIQLCH